MEENNALVINYQKAQNDIETAIQTIAPVKAIANINDADIVIKSLVAVNGLTSLPLCKVFARVKNEKLFKPSYKSFEQWASKIHGLGKASAYNYAKVGDLIDDNGTGSILYHKFNDFTYTQIVRIANAFTKEKAIELAKAEKITPYMSVKDLEKTIKKLKGVDITADTTVTENADTTVTENAVKANTSPETATKTDTEQTIEKTVTEKENALNADIEKAISEQLTPEEVAQYGQLLAVFKHYIHTEDFQIYLAKYDRKHDKAIYTA